MNKKLATAWQASCEKVASLESSPIPTDDLLKAKWRLDVLNAKQEQAAVGFELHLELLKSDLAAKDTDALGSDLPSLLSRVEAVRANPFDVKPALREIEGMIAAARIHHENYARRRSEQSLPAPGTFPSPAWNERPLEAIRARVNGEPTGKDYSDQIMMAEGEIRRIALTRAERAEKEEIERKRAENDRRAEATLEQQRADRIREELKAQRAANAAKQAADDALIAKHCPLH